METTWSIRTPEDDGDNEHDYSNNADGDDNSDIMDSTHECVDCKDQGCSTCNVPKICGHCKGAKETISGPCHECAPKAINFKPHPMQNSEYVKQVQQEMKRI